YFDFGWHLLIRPAARRSPRPSIQAIAVQIDGGSGIGLEVEPEGTGISLQTNTWRLLGQFGYLYPIDRLQVGGLVGVGVDVLSIDLNSVLPSSRIVYVRLGPAMAYDIVPSFFGFRADFGLRVPFAFGSLEDAYGSDSSGVGLDAAVTFDGRLKAGFTYAFRFIWEYYNLPLHLGVLQLALHGLQHERPRNGQRRQRHRPRDHLSASIRLVLVAVGGGVLR
ncbi:MAG: hypothetical protein JRE19_12195, partial [Deltaproteobacteria bacterium]|nr:hypothetical protein [Deltaproteobacteria bacterium]